MNSDLNNWDYLYSQGIQGQYPSEMLIRFVNKNLVKNPAMGKILDLGCGTGRHLIYLRDQNFNVYGIEGSSKAIDIANNWGKQRGYTFDLRAGSILDGSLYESNLGAVIDVSCIQHNSIDDIKLAINHIYNSLTDGGHFFSIIKSKSDSLYGTGECLQGSTYLFSSDAEKVNAPVIITFFDLEEIFVVLNRFSRVYVEKEEWTYDGMSKKVSHWIITAEK
jgi:SAM-dependent methyltransferase